MSIFWLGGEKRIVSNEEIRPEMLEDRFFLPGIIHGGDYLIMVYLNEDSDPECFEVSYLTRELILEAFRKDPLCGDDFYQHLLCGAESFGCYNDGNGDFATLVEEWPMAVYLTHTDLVRWAKDYRKVMVVDSSTENCETTVSIKDTELFYLVSNDLLSWQMATPDELDSFLTELVAKGRFNEDDEHEKMPELLYEEGKSLFGTDILTLKYWSQDDILSRFTTTYIVLPEKWGKDAAPVSRKDLPSLVGNVIESFEDFLEEKGVDIPNDEKEDDPDAAIIYGTDYGILQSDIEETLTGWGMVSPETENSPAATICCSSILLREVEDGEIYGILMADGPDAVELTSAFLSAKGDVAREDPEWQVSDVLARLPREWNARVETPGSIYI